MMIVKFIKWILAVCCVGFAILLSIAGAYAVISGAVETISKRAQHDTTWLVASLIGIAIGNGILIAIVLGLVLLAIWLIRRSMPQSYLLKNV